MKKLLLALLFVPCALFSMDNPTVNKINKVAQSAVIVHTATKPMEILPMFSPYTPLAVFAASCAYVATKSYFTKKN